MRILIPIVLCIAMFGVVQADEFRLSDVKKLVAEYVSEEANEAKRLEIAKQLLEAEQAFVGKALRSFVKDDEERGPALELAIKLRIPGLWSSIKKHIDGDHEDVIIEYGLKLQDKGAVDFLLKRWEYLETDTPSFVILHTAFRKHVLPLEHLEQLYDHLEGDKGDQAFDILVVQLGEQDIDDADDLKERWEELFANLKLYGRDFRLEGSDLLATYAWNLTNAKKVRSNYYLQSEGLLSLVQQPDKIQSGNWLIRLRVYVIKGDGAQIGIGSEQGLWFPEIKANEWLLKTGQSKTLSLPAKREQWSTVEFEITDASSGNLKNVRSISISIDGKSFTSGNLALNGELTHLYARTQADCEMVVGGLELIEK